MVGSFARLNGLLTCSLVENSWSAMEEALLELAAIDSIKFLAPVILAYVSFDQTSKTTSDFLGRFDLFLLIGGFLGQNKNTSPGLRVPLVAFRVALVPLGLL